MKPWEKISDVLTTKSSSAMADGEGYHDIVFVTPQECYEIAERKNPRSGPPNLGLNQAEHLWLITVRKFQGCAPVAGELQSVPLRRSLRHGLAFFDPRCLVARLQVCAGPCFGRCWVIICMLQPETQACFLIFVPRKPKIRYRPVALQLQNK